MNNPENTIEHDGIITSIVNGKLLVNVTVHSACSTCHAKGVCTSLDIDNKIIEVENYQRNYQVGDKVTVVLAETLGFAALFLGYGLPFIIVLVTLIISNAVLKNELQAGLLSIAILIPYYLTLYFMRQQISKKFSFRIKE